MTEKFAFNSEISLAYEANTRASIPTYDTLFAMVQSYLRVQLGPNAASLLVIGVGGVPSNPKWTFTGVDSSCTNVNYFRCCTCPVK